MFWACPIFGHAQKRWKLSVRYNMGMYVCVYIYIDRYSTCPSVFLLYNYKLVATSTILSYSIHVSQLNPPFLFVTHARCKPYVSPCRKSTQPCVRNVPELNWSSAGVGDLLPYEENWKLINHSTYLFRGGGELIPSWREVDVNKPFNILAQRGWGIWSPMKRNGS